uniref:Uncharacterized protein n=1 Tax=Magallana gigas TaxID=29159 RepID=A0A8W8NUW7_MAGGI
MSAVPWKVYRKMDFKISQEIKKTKISTGSENVKRRRLELKNERSIKDASQSVLEGATYSSKIGLEESVGLEDISMPKSVCLQKSQFMDFDLETIGLGRTSDILQIARVCGTESFNVSMKPTCCNISISASKATDSRNPKNYMAVLSGLDLTTTIWGSFNLPMTFRTVSGVNLTAKTRTV